LNLYEHPEISPQFEVMKTEVMKYQALPASIKSFEKRKDSQGKDTFDLSDWWKSNCAKVPAFAYVLPAVLIAKLLCCIVLMITAISIPR
jgi:hypothetical protein